MAFDRVEKTDPSLYRVQASSDREGRRQQPEEQEKNSKDKFEKKPSVWRRILSMNSTGPSSRLLANRPSGLSMGVSPSVTEGEEEKSLTLTERLLVLWGILGRDGRPKIMVILTYTLVLGMILGATLLIAGMTLWP